MSLAEVDDARGHDEEMIACVMYVRLKSSVTLTSNGLLLLLLQSAQARARHALQQTRLGRPRERCGVHAGHDIRRYACRLLTHCFFSRLLF